MILVRECGRGLALQQGALMVALLLNNRLNCEWTWKAANRPIDSANRDTASATG